MSVPRHYGQHGLRAAITGPDFRLLIFPIHNKNP